MSKGVASGGGLAFILGEATKLGLAKGGGSATAAAAVASSDLKLDSTKSISGTANASASDATAAAPANAPPPPPLPASTGPYRSAYTIAIWRRHTALRIRSEALASAVHSLTEYSRLLSVTEHRALNERLTELSALAAHTELLNRSHTISIILKRLTAHQQNSALTAAAPATATANGSANGGAEEPNTVVIHQQIQPSFAALLSTVATEVQHFELNRQNIQWTKQIKTEHTKLEAVWAELNRYESLYHLYSITVAALRETLYSVAHDTPLPDLPRVVPGSAAAAEDEIKSNAAASSSSTLTTPRVNHMPRASPSPRRWK